MSITIPSTVTARVDKFWKLYKLQAWWLCWCIGLPAMMVMVWGMHYQVGVNMSPSLPYSFFVVHKGDMQLQRGDLVAYHWGGSAILPKSMVLVKRVAGGASDVLSYTQNAAFSKTQFPIASLQGHFQLKDARGVQLGFPSSGGAPRAELNVKSFSLTSRWLSPGQSGVIPAEHWFVVADHEDSLDSRYADMGLLRSSQILGKVVAAW